MFAASNVFRMQTCVCCGDASEILLANVRVQFGLLAIPQVLSTCVATFSITTCQCASELQQVNAVAFCVYYEEMSFCTFALIVLFVLLSSDEHGGT